MKAASFEILTIYPRNQGGQHLHNWILFHKLSSWPKEKQQTLWGKDLVASRVRKLKGGISYNSYKMFDLGEII